MTSALRNFAPLTRFGWLSLAVLATAWPAAAQTDLNRFVPKVSSGNYDDDSYDEDAPASPGNQGPSYQRSQRTRQQQPRRQADNSRGAARASYQNSAARYQNPRYRSEDAGNDEPIQNKSPRPASTADRSKPRGRGMYEDSANSIPPPGQNYYRGPSQNNRVPRNDTANDASSYDESYEQYPDAAVSYESSADGHRSNDRGPMNYGRMNSYGRPGGGPGFGGMGGMSFGGLFGPMASRPAQPGTQGGGVRNWIPGSGSTAMNGPTPAVGTPVVLPEPVVTPDAVYLDAEPVKVGKPVGPTITMPPMSTGGTPNYEGPMMMDGAPVTGGRSFLPGGPITGRSYDGFTNPQCNDCCGGCGGNCGGCCGSCRGQRCGDNYGMYGGCEEGYDCCGGCGPNYWPWSGPYGRPWILAPIDFVFGGLWHNGPYWGACDPCGNWWWGQDFTVFGGVHDFRSPVNISGNSNFGFQEGVNWAMPLWQGFGIGAQVGFQVTQNNLQNSEIDLYDDYRKQTFLTAGLFHRPCDGCGWQYGVVFDYLHDEYYQQFNVGQLRGELGWLFDCRNELGFSFAAGVMDSDNRDDNIFLGANEYSAIDQYAFYYRRRFCRGGEGRVWGGFTGDSGGLIGADVRLPIASAWAVETGFNYVIDQKNNNPLFRDQTWNVGMNLVWYWGCNAKCRSLYRPLFNVADNGSFMVTRDGINGQR